MMFNQIDDKEVNERSFEKDDENNVMTKITAEVKQMKQGNLQLISSNPTAAQVAALMETGTFDPSVDSAKLLHDSNQLMLALYLGIGITLIILLISIIVECIRLKYASSENPEDEPKTRFCNECLCAGCCENCMTRNKSEIENLEYNVNQGNSHL